ncbi:hypothetical protein ACFV1W_23060 [Kitasatospora sp. NPDC059648]|uniref:PstS family phosphate ABC transporter substrate-binding protein n=1 Tax=Kitasatospora sp. NPDC059648 TaxID=3346894 RepID=UPI0036A80290
MWPPGPSWFTRGSPGAGKGVHLAGPRFPDAPASGYAELSYAQINHLKSATITTGASKPVEATAATTLGASTVVGTGGDLALQLDYGTKAENAYPIVLVTYEIVCDKGNKPENLDNAKAFLTYAASDAAQQAIADKGYVPMPAAVSGKVRTAVAALGWPAPPTQAAGHGPTPRRAACSRWPPRAPSTGHPVKVPRQQDAHLPGPPRICRGARWPTPAVRLGILGGWKGFSRWRRCR